MPPTSGYIQIEDFPHYRGRAHIEFTTITSVVLGKRYQIDFFAAAFSVDETTEGDKIEVGNTEAFTATGVLSEVRLNMELMPLFVMIRLYGRVQVLDGGSYVAGDVTAQFTRKQSQIEGVHCRVQCEEGCQTPCQSSCQEYCENSEETGCAVTCEIGCQGQGSQATCSLVCQNSLEYYCHTGQETGCSLSCEDSCQFSDTVACTHTCETTVQPVGELGPPGEIDDTDKAGGLLFQITRDSAGVPVAGGDLFLIGQDVGLYTLFYKKVPVGAGNSTIVTTPWVAFGFSLPSQPTFLLQPDGFQASDGSLWITFVAFNSTVPVFPAAWVTKSTDLGVTWETPISIDAFGQFASPTIFEDPDGVVIASARNYKAGFQDPAWPETGELAVQRAALSDTAATLAAATLEQLFFLPLLTYSVPPGYYGLGSGGVKMRYNTATEKYMCFFIMGSRLTSTEGACAVVHGDTIETLKYGSPYIIFPDGILAQSYLHVAIDAGDEARMYAVCEGRRRTSLEGAEGKTSLDLMLSVSRDGGYTWENEVVLTRGDKHDGVSATRLRVRLPMATILDDGRLFVSHASGDDDFSTTSIDNWLCRSYLPTEVVEAGSACLGSCETGFESTAEFVTARTDISGGIDGIRARIGIQLTRNAAGVPVAFGNILLIGVRIGTVIAGGFVYRKRVGVNCGTAAFNLTPWTRITSAPPSFVAVGVPKVYQISNGNVWIVQGYNVAGVDKLYAMRSLDLGTTWSAWALVSTSAGAIGVISEDFLSALVLYLDADGYVRYKRFPPPTPPGGLLGISESLLIKDPDKKQPIPSDGLVSNSPPQSPNTPQYRWGGFDFRCDMGGGEYMLVYAVGEPSGFSGQIWYLFSPTLDGLRFAVPRLVSPERVPMGQGLFENTSPTRKLCQYGEVRIGELASGVLIVCYDSENSVEDGLQRNQAIFRLSYDVGVTWRDPVLPYESLVNFDGFTSGWIMTDMPQGWLTHTGLQGTGSPAMIRTYVQKSDPPVPCASVCQAAFQAPCMSTCEGPVQAGGCAASCETAGMV